jgi:hypothetical protein
MIRTVPLQVNPAAGAVAYLQAIGGGVCRLMVLAAIASGAGSLTFQDEQVDCRSLASVSPRQRVVGPLSLSGSQSVRMGTAKRRSPKGGQVSPSYSTTPTGTGFSSLVNSSVSPQSTSTATRSTPVGSRPVEGRAGIDRRSRRLRAKPRDRRPRGTGSLDSSVLRWRECARMEERIEAQQEER